MHFMDTNKIQIIDFLGNIKTLLFYILQKFFI